MYIFKRKYATHSLRNIVERTCLQTREVIGNILSNEDAREKTACEQNNLAMTDFMTIYNIYLVL